jgi:Predicted Zn-dependent peptidases
MLYQRHGGVGLNASTGKDVTRYTVSLPANRLPLWAAVESDRMGGPVLREFYKERDVVLEERRLRTDDSPNGLLYEAFAAAAFEAHPYGFPTIGGPRTFNRSPRRRPNRSLRRIMGLRMPSSRWSGIFPPRV